MDIASMPPEERARIERVLAATTARGFHSTFVPDRAAALTKVLDLLPRGAKVAHGSSTTLQEIGLIDLLKRPDSGCTYQNALWTAENDGAKRARLRARLSLEADVYMGSVQAVCETGEAVAADQSGSRQAFYVFGPPRVVWVAGINKIVPDVAAGMRRVREVALPKEDARMKAAGAAGSSIGKLVIYEKERPGRTSLVLVGEPLGF
ncbi:MAG TPA: lactate utilization protein [Thermoplasmata archaeon]|jgi:L-lactate utilization protein LutB|nr:lactate utilization protein [Thermoplasmata archaeon]